MSRGLTNLSPAESVGLIAELRASRTREQQLRVHCAGLEASLAERIRERDTRQHRIDNALAWCHQANPRPDLNGDMFRDLIAALTATATSRASELAKPGHPEVW